MNNSPHDKRKKRSSSTARRAYRLAVISFILALLSLSLQILTK
jgi:hypothetical protein